MRIKICGNTNLDDARAAAELGAWAVGLIHHPDSPRYVEPDIAAEIGAALKRRCEVAGVFVDTSLDEIVRAADDEQLTIVQLHGDQGPSFCREVARRTGAKVMKAFRVRTPADVRGAEAFRTDFHLFDAYRAGAPGGTGESFDWELVAARRSQIPFLLAGGLTPENVGEAIAAARPWGVDVVSGVEAEPGPQGPRALAAFFEAVALDRRDLPRQTETWRRPPGLEHAPGSARLPAAGDDAAIEERFGPYGGRYVPETLIPALDELAAGLGGCPGRRVLRRRARPPASGVRRPPDAALPRRAALGCGQRPRVPEARGPRAHRRAQDQQRRRAGASRQAHGEGAA